MQAASCHTNCACSANMLKSLANKSGIYIYINYYICICILASFLSSLVQSMLSATPTWHRVASGSITSHKLACSTAAHMLTSLLMPHATVWHSHAALATCGSTRSADSIAFSFSSRRVGIDSPASYLLHLHVACACCCNTHKAASQTWTCWRESFTRE